MKWLKRMRKKNKTEEAAIEPDVREETGQLLDELKKVSVHVEREKINVKDPQARILYLERLYEAIQEAKRQCEGIKFEYGQVTSYLKDIQLIDQAPEEEKETLLSAAAIIVELTKERKKSQKRDYRVTDAQQRVLENNETKVRGDVKKILGFEDFQMKIKHDLRQLGSEKNLLMEDKRDIIQRQSMLKIVGKCLTALVIAAGAMLGVLAFCFKIDISMPFVITAGVCFLLAAIVLNEARKNRIDMVITEKKCNRAIALSNRVKIKYVNNVRTLDYMYHKYQVRNAMELEFIFNQYCQAKKEWARQRESSIRINENNQIVLAELKRFGVKDCDIWLGQIQALVDPKEMVEVRHELNVQRGKLREQLDYNTGVMEECLEEIDKIRSRKPEYAAEVEQILRGKNIAEESKE